MENTQKQRGNLLQRAANVMVKFVQNYLPSPFTLAVVLTLIVFVVGLLVGTSFMDLTQGLANGMFSLFPFTMQMVLVLVTGHVLASSPVVIRLLERLAGIPKTRVQAVMFTAVVAYIASYINWGFGLIAGAIIARQMAAQNKGKMIHYPIIIAAAYSGNIARGPSSSIPLAVATEGHVMQDLIGIIPVGQTLYAGYNIIITIALLILIPILFKFMMPSEKDSIEFVPDTEETKVEVKKTTKKTFAEKLDTAPVLAFVIGLLWVVYLVDFFRSSATFNLNLNTVILIFFTLGIFAHGNLERYSNAVGNGVKTSAGIILQFPFYAAIMTLMNVSGLTQIISNFFISIANADTLPVMTFWSAGLVNIFVPSGGGQWAVQGPIMMEAADALGADPGRVAMALAWGDSWTNQIQPFWALPALAIANLKVRDIMGYCIMVLLLAGVVISAGFLLL